MTWGARLLIVWVAALPLVSAVRVPVWGSEIGVWADAADRAPFKLRPQVQLGTLLHKQGRLEDAERHYLGALARWERGRPRFERVGCEAARFNYSVLMQQRGDWRGAAEWVGYPCGS